MKLGLVPCPASLPLVSRLDISTNFFTPAFFAASTRCSVPCSACPVHLNYTAHSHYTMDSDSVSACTLLVRKDLVSKRSPKTKEVSQAMLGDAACAVSNIHGVDHPSYRL